LLCSHKVAIDYLTTTSMASESGSTLHCLSWIEEDKPSYVSTIIPFKIHL